VIDEDEYEHVDPRLDDEAFARLLEAGRPVDGLVSDLDRNLEETGSRRARRYAQMLAERLFREGVQLYLGARLAEARQRFEAALDLDATSPDAWSNLGYVHFDTGALEEAKTSFERALSLAPDHENSHYGLAMTCRKRGERDMAILHFRRYLELVPAGRFTDRARLELAALERTVSP
jgi:Tfp pilus assembly protein PilF